MENEPDFFLRRRDGVAIGLSDSTLWRSVRRGETVRVGPGSYVAAESWAGLTPIRQHRLRVLAAAERLTAPRVFSHFAAAALWGIRILGDWPTVVDVTVDRASGGRSDGGFRRHCSGIDDADVMVLDGLLVTSPNRTVVDLARILPFADAVVAMDSALHARRIPHPLTTIEAIRGTADAAMGLRGCRVAVAAADFATPLSDSPPESHSRVQMWALGFPRPILQHPFVLADGSVVRADFFWDQFRHIGECDGRAKYRDLEYLRGRTPEQALIAEKNRENELRRQVRMLSRWEPAELRYPQRFYDRLTTDGLPSSRPRPRA